MNHIKRLRFFYLLFKILILIFIIFYYPIFLVKAQTVFKFFEFAPRSTDKIILDDTKLVQPFIPFNDFLSGFDLFLNNPEGGEFNLYILDKYNNLLWQKKAVLPSINGGWYGEPYFFSLGDNYGIRSGEEYRLVIENFSLPKLEIFMKNLLEILQGTESGLYFPETLKPLKINNQTSDYTLKLSLYENKEYLPPIISNFKIEMVSPRSVKIIFNSNEPIIYKLDYRKDSENSTSTYSINYFENCPYSIRNCEIGLNVLPDSHYIFILTASDYWNNTTTLKGEFDTPQEVSPSTPTDQTSTKTPDSYQSSPTSSTTFLPKSSPTLPTGPKTKLETSLKNEVTTQTKKDHISKDNIVSSAENKVTEIISRQSTGTTKTIEAFPEITKKELIKIGPLEKLLKKITFKGYLVIIFLLIAVSLILRFILKKIKK